MVLSRISVSWGVWTCSCVNGKLLRPVSYSWPHIYYSWSVYSVPTANMVDAFGMYQARESFEIENTVLDLLELICGCVQQRVLVKQTVAFLATVTITWCSVKLLIFSIKDQPKMCLLQSRLSSYVSSDEVDVNVPNSSLVDVEFYSAHFVVLIVVGFSHNTIGSSPKSYYPLLVWLHCRVMVRSGWGCTTGRH